MPRKDTFHDFESYEDPSLLADLDEEALYDAAPTKAGRRGKRQKNWQRKVARNRFSDYEDTLWLRRQVEDWDDYDGLDDYDDNDFYVDMKYRE